MTKHYPSRSLRAALGIALGVVLLGAAVTRPAHAAEEPAPSAAADAHAGEKSAAVKAMEGWLGGIDKGEYKESWQTAAESFKQALTAEQWAQALTSVREPLGKLKERKLMSALYQTAIPQPSGKETKGVWVIAQFESSFDHLASALETVTFEKEKDGQWRAAGYYIKPN